MLVSSIHGSQNSIPNQHLMTHSIAPVKIHPNNTYPLQLTTNYMPLHIPGSVSNINVPMQLSGSVNSVHLSTPTVTVPIQVTTTNVPGQLTAGETINVPLQIPTPNPGIQISTSALPSLPLLPTSTQPLSSSIVHVHMGTNGRTVTTTMENVPDISITHSNQIIQDASSIQKVKINNSNSAPVHIPNTSNSPIQLQLPNVGTSGPVQLRGTARPMPQMVYIQTPTGLKPVTSSEVISQASSCGNPPQIIVRKPVSIIYKYIINIV